MPQLKLAKAWRQSGDHPISATKVQPQIVRKGGVGNRRRGRVGEREGEVHGVADRGLTRRDPRADRLVSYEYGIGVSVGVSVSIDTGVSVAVATGVLAGPRSWDIDL